MVALAYTPLHCCGIATSIMLAFSLSVVEAIFQPISPIFQPLNYAHAIRKKDCLLFQQKIMLA